MVESIDVGSLPFSGNFETFLDGAISYSQSTFPFSSSTPDNYFKKKIVQSFIHKLKAGINIPNYPQFRDMHKTYLDLIDGLKKIAGGYVESGILSIQADNTFIPEVAAIRNNSSEIVENIENPFKIKVCVTGPYTLSTFFIHRDEYKFNKLGEIISRIVENNIFSGKNGSVGMVTVDEPTFGLIDDPLIDYGTQGRENLQKAWEMIFHNAASRGIPTCLHLHDTTNDLFWEVNSLNIVESHLGDLIYTSKKTKKNLESTDKFLKASICISNFDQLIRTNIVASPQQKSGELTIDEKVAETWKNITSGKLDPTIFIENVELMQKRLIKIFNQFGAERVPYAGPECGLISFPTYESALECLRRTSNAVQNESTNSNFSL